MSKYNKQYGGSFRENYLKKYFTEIDEDTRKQLQKIYLQNINIPSDNIELIKNTLLKLGSLINLNELEYYYQPFSDNKILLSISIKRENDNDVTFIYDFRYKRLLIMSSSALIQAHKHKLTFVHPII